MHEFSKKKCISEIEMEAASDQFSTKKEVIYYSIMITRRLDWLWLVIKISVKGCILCARLQNKTLRGPFQQIKHRLKQVNKMDMKSNTWTCTQLFQNEFWFQTIIMENNMEKQNLRWMSNFQYKEGYTTRCRVGVDVDVFSVHLACGGSGFDPRSGQTWVVKTGSKSANP